MQWLYTMQWLYIMRWLYITWSYLKLPKIRSVHMLYPGRFILIESVSLRYFVLEILKVWKYKNGLWLFQEGQYAKGETILHAALTIAQNLNHSHGITYVYTLLAALAFQQVFFFPYFSLSHCICWSFFPLKAYLSLIFYSLQNKENGFPIKIKNEFSIA